MFGLKPSAVRRNGLCFDIPQQGDTVAIEKPKCEPKRKTPRVKSKNDPRLVAAARELRDRSLELVNATLLPSQGKYDLSRALPDGPTTVVNLNAPALLRALPAPIAA